MRIFIVLSLLILGVKCNRSSISTNIVDVGYIRSNNGHNNGVTIGPKGVDFPITQLSMSNDVITSTDNNDSNMIMELFKGIGSSVSYIKR